MADGYNSESTQKDGDFITAFRFGFLVKAIRILMANGLEICS